MMSRHNQEVALASLTPEQLDAQADKVGVLLSEVDEQIRLLFVELNFGPDMNDEQESALHVLSQVRSLVEIATELYPYPTNQ